MRMMGQCPTQIEAQQVIIDIELLRRKKVAAKKAALEKQKAEDSKKKKGKGKKKRAVKGIRGTLSIFGVDTCIDVVGMPRRVKIIPKLW